MEWLREPLTLKPLNASWQRLPETEGWWWDGINLQWEEFGSADLVTEHLIAAEGEWWWGPVYPPETPQTDGERLAADASQAHRTTGLYLLRAADIVHHAPSGDDWVLAVDEENGRVQPCGWPPTMADAKDCTLTTPATAEHRIVMLDEWAAEGKGYEHERDSRTRAARRQISSEDGLRAAISIKCDAMAAACSAGDWELFATIRSETEALNSRLISELRAGHENGSYYCKCLDCDADFVGHKRRHICRKCHYEAKARYDALTPEEQAAFDEKQNAEIRAFFKTNADGDVRREPAPPAH